MKDIVQPMPAERSMEQEAFANRKLIRPSLNHSNHTGPSHSAPIHSGPNHPPQQAGERREHPERPKERSNGARKAPPPDQTNAENFYYQKRMQSKTPMVIVMADD